jgi:hypothetical protein
LVCMYVCIRTHLASTINDIFVPISVDLPACQSIAEAAVAAAEEDAAAAGGPVPGAAAGSGGASASSAAPTAAPVPSPPKSTHGALEAAKHSMSSTIKGAGNTLHAVARMLANEDLHRDVQILIAATRPITAQFSYDAHALRGPQECEEFYVHNAHWGFMSQLKETLLVATKPDLLCRLGLFVDYSPIENLGYCDVHAVIATQDDMMQSFWRFVFNMLRSHSIVMVRHIFGWPYLLAGLLHPDPARQKDTFAFLKEAEETRLTARTKGSPDIQKMVSQLPMQSTVSELAILFARAGRWRTVTPQMAELLSCLFRGIGATKLIEDCVQKLRDHETRDASSNIMCHFEQWSAPIGARLLADFNLPEIQPATSASHRVGFDAGSLFSQTHGSDGQKDSVDVRRILGEQQWLTFNSQTIWS